MNMGGIQRVVFKEGVWVQKYMLKVELVPTNSCVKERMGSQQRFMLKGGWVGYKHSCSREDLWITNSCIQCRMGGIQRFTFKVGFVDYSTLSCVQGRMVGLQRFGF